MLSEIMTESIIMQHRVAQDTILFKDGQLKDAQAWIARLQEMGALQQAELREHVDQFHQYYMSLQRQVGLLCKVPYLLCFLCSIFE